MPRSLLLPTLLMLWLGAIGGARAQPAPEPSARATKTSPVLQEWRKYKAWLQHHVPEYHRQLNGPATLEEIQALEAELGVQLPEDFKDLYLENNGQQEAFVVSGSMLGHSFLSLQQISFFWKRDVVPGSQTPGVDSRIRAFQPGTVQNRLFTRRWIPLFTDTEGVYLGYDFSPGPEGRQGQIINFGARVDQHCVLASDLTGFLKRINSQLEKTDLQRAIFMEDGHRYIHGFSNQGHLTDDLVGLTTRGATRDMLIRGDKQTKVVITPQPGASAPTGKRGPAPVPIPPPPSDLRVPVPKK
ncbi:SMI1/KNR4 family protein [Corallococcus interemptor]|uniref:SMI1/KNR4 family protein n=1 Tax=Corallococcus interemptor TaxID=2316720 RepID=UPI003D0795A8